MSEKLFVVTVKVFPPDGAIRLIAASGVKEIADYLLSIKKATPQDVAAMMASGVKVERVNGAGK